MDLLNKNWQQGKKFRVKELFHSDGINWTPGVNYLIVGPDYVQRPDGAMLWVNTDGKKAIADYVVWPSDLGISNELCLLIKKHPESKYIPGFIRQEIGTSPTKKNIPKTEEGWLGYVKKTLEDKKKKAEADLKKIKAKAPPAPPPPERMITVRVEASESVRGTAYFTRMDLLVGDVPVPEGIIHSGVITRVVDYLYDHLRDHCRRREGEMEMSDSQIDESDGMDVTFNNAREVIAAESLRRTTIATNIAVAV